MELDQITEKIIGCAYIVGNGLGAGFLEKIYENALAHQIRKTGLAVQQKAPVNVRYDNIIVGEYFVDLFAD